MAVIKLFYSTKTDWSSSFFFLFRVLSTHTGAISSGEIPQNGQFLFYSPLLSKVKTSAC